MKLSRRLLIVIAFLLVTISLRAWLNTSPPVPLRKSFVEYPDVMGPWTMVATSQLSDDVSGVLKADDYMLRKYRNADGRVVDMFVAYYKTQAAGESMHSPK